MSLQIPPPDNLTQAPDAATKKGLAPDLTGRNAGGRVFYLDMKFLRYGSDDKTHAAAFIFAVILLFTTIAFYIAGFFTTNAVWAGEAVKWSGSTFLFVAGIVLGKSMDRHGDREAD